MTRQMAGLDGVGELAAAELGLAETIEDWKSFAAVAAAVDDSVDVSDDDCFGSCHYIGGVAPSGYHCLGSLHRACSHQRNAQQMES